MAWLAALKSDPSDGNSPTLVVGDGSLTDAQRETVVGAAYARRRHAWRNWRRVRAVIHAAHGHAGVIHAHVLHGTERASPQPWLSGD